ncbi:MAG: hypothetical protein GY820_22175 [Gammaproteobacteria bacterium]|nr:hypothetical protein [Gammaproteobacteria bacterium]
MHRNFSNIFPSQTATFETVAYVECVPSQRANLFHQNDRRGSKGQVEKDFERINGNDGPSSSRAARNPATG